MSDASDQPVESERQVPVTVEAREVASVPRELLEEAVTQLRSLRELRQQELQRQEGFLEEMRGAAGRQRRAARFFSVVALLVLLALIVLTVHIVRVRGVQDHAALRLDTLANRMGTASELVRESAAQQQAAVAAVGERVASDLSASVAAMRAERDVIRVGVKEAIDEQNQNFMTRELSLRDEEARLAQQAEETRQERLRVIGETIARLQAMAAQLDGGEGETAEEAEEAEAEASGAEGEAGAVDAEAEVPADEGAGASVEEEAAGDAAGEENGAETGADGGDDVMQPVI